MTLKTKKIIAREFIIMLGCLAIPVILFFYNSYFEFQQWRVENKVELLDFEAKRLSEIYKKKENNQNAVTFRLNSNYFSIGSFGGISNSELWTVLYQRAKADSIEYYWNNVWDVALKNAIGAATKGINNPKSFQNFIIGNIINKTDIDNQEIIKSKQNSIKVLLKNKDTFASKTIPNTKLMKIGLFVFLIAFGSIAS